MKKLLLLIASSIILLSAIHAQTCIIADYPFNGNADDETSNGFNGATIGAALTTDHMGNSNAAYHFDGVDDYIEINNNNPVITTNEFTIFVWAKMDGQGGGIDQNNVLFSQRDDPTTTGKSIIHFNAQNASNEIMFKLRGSNTATGTGITSPSLPYGEWHSYAGVLKADGSMHLYVDSIEVSNGTANQSGDYYTSIDYVNIGRHAYSGSPRSYFNGDMSHVMIFDCALDSAAIDSLWRTTRCNGVEIMVSTSICDGDSIFLEGNYQTIAGTYHDTLKTSLGCDSVIITSLTVHPAYQTNINLSICSGDSTLLGGSYQTAAGSYYDTLQTGMGCDSIIKTLLTINPVYETTIDTVICAGDSIFAQGAYQTTAGTYYDSLQTVNGCDSVIITEIGICSGILGNTRSELISVYPNPSTDVINVSIGNADNFNYTIQIFNMLGQKVYHSTVHTQKISIDINEWHNGAYFLQISNSLSKKVETMRVIKY